MSSDRSDLGRAGEDAALACYVADGWQPVARNWRCSLGEVDLIVARGSTLVFCEVKTRASGWYGGPFEAVTGAKRRKLRQLALAFLVANGAPPSEIRFDVASVTRGPNGAPSVHLFADAF